jgi:hypothetical protein
MEKYSLRMAERQVPAIPGSCPPYSYRSLCIISLFRRCIFLHDVAVQEASKITPM